MDQFLASVMPSSYKEAIITPILKKPDLNTEDLKTYRPISYLSCVSKLIKKVVAKQITNKVSTNNLDEPMQSSYRASHSTETALYKIYNDTHCHSIVTSVLISLDLPAAFDTIDYQILLARLVHRFGITGRCLHWIKSY